MDRVKDVLIIPRSQVILKFIEIPSTQPSEIKNIVELQALRELPYAGEEIVAGFRNIGSYKKGYSYIMLAIIRRQQLEEMIARRKARPDSIRLETELLYMHVLKNGMVSSNKVSFIVNSQKGYSEIMIMDNAKPVFSRGLSAIKTLPEEIGKSLISYKADKNNKEAEEAVFVHDLSLDAENTKVCLEALLHIPVNFYEDKPDFKNIEPFLEIDLLPKEYIHEKINRENAKQIFLTYFLLSIVIFMLVSFFGFKIREKNKILLVFSDKTKKIQKDLDQLDIFLEKIKLVKYQKKEGEAAINILKECYELMPQDIFLEGLDSDGKGVIYCAGMAKDINRVFDFIKILEKSKYFKKIEVKYAAKKKNGNLEFTDFNIECFAY